MTTMNFCWIAGTILIAVLINFMVSAVFGFNLLGRIYQLVLHCFGKPEDMEEVRWKIHFSGIMCMRLINKVLLILLVSQQFNKIAKLFFVVIKPYM